MVYLKFILICCPTLFSNRKKIKIRHITGNEMVNISVVDFSTKILLINVLSMFELITVFNCTSNIQWRSLYIELLYLEVKFILMSSQWEKNKVVGEKNEINIVTRYNWHMGKNASKIKMVGERGWIGKGREPEDVW